MYSAQELSTAVKSVVNGFRPVDESISLDVNEVSDVDVLLTYALTARSLDEASAAVERVLELEPENEVANAGFTWFLGVRDSADRLEQAEAACDSGDNERDDMPTAEAVDAADESSDEDVFSTELFSSEGPAEAKAAGDTVKESDVDFSSDNSGFSAELPYAFQQVVEPLIASKEEEDDASAAAEQEAKEREEAEAAAAAEQEEKEREEAEAAAAAEQEAKEREEAEAAAAAEQEEKEREEAEAAAAAEQEAKEREEAEAAAAAEQEAKEREESEASAAAEQEAKEREEAEATAKAQQEEQEREEAEAAAKAQQEEQKQEEAVVAEAEELADEVHEAAIAPSSSTAKIAPAEDGEKLTILTVDDSPTIRKLLMMTLEREGFNVVQAQDGVEALVKMSECNPSMILSDINMPRLDGYKLCKFVKKHAKTKHIPVIMLSGKDGVFDKLRGRMSGCDGYLTKPFESKDLLEKIQSFIGTHA